MPEDVGSVYGRAGFRAFHGIQRFQFNRVAESLLAGELVAGAQKWVAECTVRYRRLHWMNDGSIFLPQTDVHLMAKMGYLALVPWSVWLGTTGDVLLAITLVVVCVIAWGANLIALPGNWAAVAVLALYAWLAPADGRCEIGMGAVIGAFSCALLGEIFEFFASAVGANRAGASRRATVYAVIGSMVGAMVGAAVGVPVPVVGSVLAAILFGGVGATAGAMYGEWTNGKPWRESWTVGHAAFWGRTTGTIGKMVAGLGVVLIAIVGVLV